MGANSSTGSEGPDTQARPTPCRSNTSNDSVGQSRLPSSSRDIRAAVQPATLRGTAELRSQRVLSTLQSTSRPQQHAMSRPQQHSTTRVLQQSPAQPQQQTAARPQQHSPTRVWQQSPARPQQQTAARPQQHSATRVLQQSSAQPQQQTAAIQQQDQLNRPLSLLSMDVQRPTNRTGSPERRGGHTANRNLARGGNQHRGNNRQFQSNRHDNNDASDQRGAGCERPRYQVKHMGFRLLEEISKLDSLEALLRMSNQKNALLELLQSDIQPDFHFLLLKILSNICHSTFAESKGHVLIEVCNSNYIPSLQHYLMNLPYVMEMDKQRNRLYWSEPIAFWEYLLVFCETIVVLSPSTAMQRCRALVEGSTAMCLDGLSTRHHLSLPSDVTTRLESLRKKFAECEKVEEEKKIQANPRLFICQDELQPPPEDFRVLPVLPTSGDLLGRMPYVRPNIVAGGYESVDHYLDVQFRLLREDCYGPLREGIRQYNNDKTKRRYDNIRVHRDVTLLEPYQSKSNVGVILQFEKPEEDKNQKIKKRKTIWAHSKRFLFGALLLLSNDGCKTFIIATVLDRDLKLLEEGLLPVEVNNNHAHAAMKLFGQKFLMIESEVYFEPYHHVLKALQDPTFPEHLAMKDYIVSVEPATNPPGYLSPLTSYKVKVGDNILSPSYTFQPLRDDSWPSAEELGLDPAQYAAYKLALTHEFAVIQGPPGTGKTYLGVRVARTLLDNRDALGRNSTMLVICFTNHALDQFLEAILHVTHSIVRIGGQSKSETMNEYNLNVVRRLKADRKTGVNGFYYEKRDEMSRLTNELFSLQSELDIVNNGLVNFAFVCEYVDEAYRLESYGPQGEDAVTAWLFENAERNYRAEPVDDDVDEQPAVQEDNRDEHLILDDDINLIRRITLKNLFNVEDIKRNIRNWTGLLNTCQTQDQYNTIHENIKFWRARIMCFMVQRRRRFEGHNIKWPDNVSPAKIGLDQRWAIYFNWMKIIRRNLVPKIAKLQAQQRVASVKYEEARMMVDRVLLKGVRVVGMTTTGAARLQKLIRSIAPNIVIVEEAAEVLESHIVVSLTKHCQHLILIGDHQQLRPSAAHFKLARHYNMEISLFERMITNGIHSRRLGVQHRMRPAIASLIVPAIYPELQNHISVESFPSVRGLAANLFFFTHDNAEDPVDDSSSRRNRFEGDLTLGLANYIMQQGYEPEDVTILAAYSGQMFYMRKERDRYHRLRDVKITVVDNYQGEESKIILLSLVRNNSDGNIGFLGTANRVCVALSRAKEGFYIFGNMAMLKKATELWQTIGQSLEEQGALGSSITLRCENHPDQITEVTSIADFQKSPEGGCMLKCDINLACSHLCPLICHPYDRPHLTIKCPLKCERVICELGHVCPLPCADTCAPCAVLVVKTLLCGHAQAVACHLDAAEPAVKCLTLVEVTLPACGHKAEKACYVNVNSVPCPEPCEFRLPCGHACVNHCHKTKDPEHDHYTCEKPCGNTKKGCKAVLEGGELGNHACAKKCYETCNDCDVEVVKKRKECGHRERVECSLDIDATPCRKQCKRSLPCGHHCRRKCYEECGNCMQMVTKVLPSCGHDVKILCKDAPQAEDCVAKCERTMPCGHKCTGRCNAPCDPDKCKEVVPRAYRAPCGHDVNLPCFQYKKGLPSEEMLLRACRAPCDALLACEHTCAGSCGECLQRRLHVPCTQPCRRLLLCGHECEEPCKEVCPPCPKPCEVRCQHTRCGQICGMPCPPCKEKCSRGCPHGRCERACSDKCSRPPCNEPCPLTRACGHRCCGLCGEACPDVCRECDPVNFPTDLLGEPYEDDAKIIQLLDCKAKPGHFLDVENMDNLMLGDRETIMIRSCPFCRTHIVNSGRYKDQINDTFRREINPIKIKIYGDKQKIKKQWDELYLKSEKIIEEYKETMKDQVMLQTGLARINNELKNKRRKMSLLQVNMRAVGLEVMERVAENYAAWLQEGGGEFKEHLNVMMATLCAVLTAPASKISEQQQRDVERELRRMRALVQLACITCTPQCRSARDTTAVRDAVSAAACCVLSWEPYDEPSARDALHALQKAVNVSGIVTQEERQLIVKAMQLAQGHWYKCPNGHIYCITECGGAMEKSRCPECKEEIGGTNHALLPSNRVASEMDGARHAAWSEHANNMANWQLDL